MSLHAQYGAQILELLGNELFLLVGLLSFLGDYASAFQVMFWPVDLSGPGVIGSKDDGDVLCCDTGLVFFD